MFTGIVTEVGRITGIALQGDTRVTVACAMDPAKIMIGASIACSGVCLTVVDRGGEAGKAWFAVDVSGETRAHTAPALWQEDAPVNLEPALRLGDELGGHLVYGHVDGTGTVVSMTPEGGSVRSIAVAPVDKVVDTNGAGDAFVGGFLALIAEGASVDAAVRAGHWAAAHVIQRSGCTFDKSVKYERS